MSKFNTNSNVSVTNFAGGKAYMENPILHEEKYYPCNDCGSCKRMVYDGFVNKTKDYIEPVVDISETHENN